MNNFPPKLKTKDLNIVTDTGFRPGIVARVNTGLNSQKLANLFAAAPDLLAACEAAYEFINSLPDGEMLDGEQQTLGLLKQAIAKAKGEQL